MSKHSDKEARIISAYLSGINEVTYQGFKPTGGNHYSHQFEFGGTRIKYSHGGQRPTDPAEDFISDARKGISKILRATNREAVAVAWEDAVR
jgi:hypothetical protein